MQILINERWYDGCMDMADGQKSKFRETVWEYYRAHGRHDLPWRTPEYYGAFDPYKILVSELMLQQTQVVRVVPKYHEFLAHFPTVKSVADDELGEILRVWQGLGYNRRAKFLHKACQKICTDGAFSDTIAELVKLPGVGLNTAGAIMSYAYNEPVVFIETNIRTVFLHHFFQGAENVSDACIRGVVAQTLDHEHPREWYWALMDYGAYLKTHIRNNAQSKHYAKQSRFAGSRRQVRGAIIRLLSRRDMTRAELEKAVVDPRCTEVIHELCAEGLIHFRHKKYSL